MRHIWANLIDALCWVIVLPAMAYLGYRTYESSDDRAGLVRRWIFSAALVLLMLVILWVPVSGLPLKPLFILFPALVLGRIWTPSIGAFMAGPLTSLFDGGNEEAEAKPFYFIAEGLRRKGQYEAAIAEVRKQLERFPGDYEGYTKLATIQMENLKDLAAAEATLNEFLAIPGRAPNEVVGALHLLADWQLQDGRSARAADATLRRIVQLFPGTAFSHAAEQRLAHLVSADEASHARHERKFTVGAGQRDIGLRKESAPVAAAVADPHERAAEYVKQLELHPFDTEAREHLAVLYAEEFQRLDLAADQLEQLIALPSEPPKRVAHWLNLLATLHVRHAHNLEAAQAALRRIPERFPGSALASVAATRLAGLNGELKAGQRTAPKTLGLYEKDLGLKKAGGQAL